MPSSTFDIFLKKISATRSEVDDLLAQNPNTLESLSDATTVMLWHTLYDNLLRGCEEDLCKLGGLIEKLYKAITDRKIAQLRIAKESTKSPDSIPVADSDSIATAEAKLRLL